MPNRRPIPGAKQPDNRKNRPHCIACVAISYRTGYHHIMKNIKVLSVGGSIVAPDAVDKDFLIKFKKAIMEYLDGNPDSQLVFVVGGGGPARAYQKAYREIVDVPNSDSQDWIGIMATRLNGELLKGVFSDDCLEPVVTDPTSIKTFRGRILVAAGWKPGFSTDNDSVLLAENIGADTVINLSNIKKVYSADPKLDPGAVPLDNISWEQMKKLVGDKWIPGVNVHSTLLQPNVLLNLV